MLNVGLIKYSNVIRMKMYNNKLIFFILIDLSQARVPPYSYNDNGNDNDSLTVTRSF